MRPAKYPLRQWVKRFTPLGRLPAEHSGAVEEAEQDQYDGDGESDACFARDDVATEVGTASVDDVAIGLSSETVSS